jgi:hypothetical protein
MLNVLAIEAKLTGINVPSILPWGIIFILLAIELGLSLSAKENAHWTVNRLRVGLIVGAIVGAGIMLSAPNPLVAWISLPILLLVIAEEIIGRRLFYEVIYERVL